MKRIFWIIGGIVAAIVIVAGGALVFFVSNIDSIVEAAVEEVGSDVTKVKVSLDKADVSITSGKATLSGLTVGNPQGFKTDYAFALGAVSVALDTASIGKQPIVIKEVRITAPKVTYEMNAQGASNVDTIKKNVDASMGGGQAKGPGSPGGGAPSGGAGGGAKKSSDEAKLVIENVYITGGEVAVSADFLAGRKMGAPLPAIHLKDVGKKGGGASPAEVAEQIMAALTQNSAKAVAGLNLQNLMKGIDPSKAIEGAKGVIGDPSKALESGGDAAKRLLGR
jgi:hypothetical protein